MKALAANARTVQAIRKADALPTDISGQRLRMGKMPSTGGGGSGGGSIPAKVLSKSGLYYLCDLYGDGIDEAATLEDQRVYVLQLNLAATLPAGTWIMVSLNSIGLTGGGNVP